MKDNLEGIIREIQEEDGLVLREALELVRHTFMQTTADDYEEKGITTFLEYIQLDNIRGLMEKGRYRLWCYQEDGEVRGMIGIRDKTHISLLFVEESYWGKGIAHALFTRAVLEEVPGQEISVHSSPYAVPVYQALGFEVLEEERVEDGIRHTPMCYRRK